ncbi:hypothetical protein D9611_007373 [Ephemerocybe angulata]|uniref:Endonuclease/exonuclease/phosphatase domain-containing protein n=1 Tax=Ephemerocybe angulata TaxID=980116 RepID=A0A8H5FLH6_9AGAR|nr:hypothetical protein D9611_007373 [Tulosesus angulatus]
MAGRDYVFRPPCDPAQDSALSGGRGFQQHTGAPKPSKPSALTQGKKPSALAAPGPDSAVQDVEMGEASQKLPNPAPSGQKPPAPGPIRSPLQPRDARFTKRKPTSFAAAAKTAPSSKVAAAPHVLADDILRMHAIVQGTPSSTSGKKKKKNPSHTTAGPSRKQVLVEFKLDRNPGNSVPYDTVEVDHIRGYLHCKLPDAVAWVGLPSSKSFLRLPNVPFILDGKSNLRIKPEDITRAFEASPLRSDLVLAGLPRVVRNSKSSTCCDVFFDIWDSQQGLRAQRLIKKELLIYGQKTSIVTSAAAARVTPKLSPRFSPPLWVRSAPIRGSAWHAARTATEFSTASVPSGTIALTALGLWPSIPSSTDSKIRILSFNIAKNYAYLDITLDRLKDEFNILFIQEPPWQTIRQAPMVSKEGADVIGAPATCAGALAPCLHQDLLDDHDIMIVSLFGRDRVLHFMNVYSDNQHRAIKLLAEKADALPALSYMGGNFNCHSREWDPWVLHHRTMAILLLETAARLGLDLTKFTNPGRLARRHTIKPDSDEEAEFISELVGVIGGLKQHPITTADEVEDFAQAIAGACNEAWLHHSKEFKVKPHSKEWWDAGCDAALAAYRADQTLASYKALRTATKAAKRKFFDARIKEVAETNKRP